MHIVVCIKQILDPEIPPRDFRIDSTAKEAVQGNAPLVIGPFDLNALEVALQLKERHAGTKITVLTLGAETAIEALRQALAMGTDQAVLVSHEGIAHQDATITARVLGRAITRLDSVDLILTGRQAGDWDRGQVGVLLAEELDLPCIPFAPRLTILDRSAQVERETTGSGYTVFETPLPAVISITNAEDNAPRFPKVKDIMMARRKLVTRWSASDLGLQPEEVGPAAQRVEIIDLFIPHQESSCEIIEGESAAEKAHKLFKRLVELKLI